MTTIPLLWLATVAASAASAATPDATFTTTLDLAYVDVDAAPEHILDLYMPDVDEPPLFIWIHGGAWALGSPRDEAQLASRFARAGIAVAAIDHRRSPATWAHPSLTEGVQHPAHANDCARAFAWLFERSGTLGFDRSRMFIGGFSSGAHLAALLALDPSYLADVGRSPEDLRGAVPISGGFDMAEYHQILVEGNGREMADAHVFGVFGSEDLLPAASPIAYLGETDVPFLVVSDEDTAVYTESFERAVGRLPETAVRFMHADGLDHAGLYRELSATGAERVFDAVVAFLQAGALP